MNIQKIVLVLWSLFFSTVAITSPRTKKRSDHKFSKAGIKKRSSRTRLSNKSLSLDVAMPETSEVNKILASLSKEAEPPRVDRILKNLSTELGTPEIETILESLFKKKEQYQYRFARLRNAIVSGDINVFYSFYNQGFLCDDDEIYYALQYVSRQYSLDCKMNHEKFGPILILMRNYQPYLYYEMSLRLACGDDAYYNIMCNYDDI